MPSEKKLLLFYGFSERLILVTIVLSMISNLTITGSAPRPLLHNLRCELETVTLFTVYIYGCLLIG